MATTPTYPVETDLMSALTGQMADAVFAKDTETDTTVKQDTTSATDQNTATTGSTDSTQLTDMLSAVSGSSAQQQTGTTAQQQAGTQTQNTVGTTGTTGGTTQNTTQQQATTGNTSTIGSQATTGTVGTSGTQSTTGTQTTSQNADTTALREVLSRQLGGATPEMLQAIFQEGAKAAPNLVVAQAGALGARGVGNSPMAQVLNQLNADLTNKAAMLNVQMLSDAGNTAGKIADLTKSSTTATDQTTKSTSEQVQDLLTSTNTQQLSKQIADTVNATVGTMNQQQTQSQATTGTTAMNTTGQTAQNTNQQSLQNTNQSTNVTANVDTTQNQAQTGTQTQSSTLTKDEQVRQQQVLNSNLLGKSAGLLASGLGLAAAFNAAKSAGYIGKAADFVKGLLDGGTAPAIIDRALRMDNLPGIVGSDGVLDLSGLADFNMDSLIGNLPDLGGSILPDIGGGFFDGVGDFLSNFADGGKLEFLPPPNLNGPAKKPEADNSLQAMLDGALGFTGSGSSSGASGGSGESATPVQEGGGEGGAAGGSAGNVGSVSIGNIGQGTGMSNSQMGTIGSIAANAIGVTGLLGNVVGQAVNDTLNAQANTANAESANASVGISEGFGTVGGVSIGGNASVGSTGGFGIGIGDGQSAVGPGIGSVSSEGMGLGSIGGMGDSSAGGMGIGGGNSSSSGGAGGSAAGEGPSGDSGGGGGGGSGGCFLTTAAEKATAESESELNIMRGFRDKVMRSDPKLSSLVDEYYKVAPQVVKALDARPDSAEIYKQMREQYIMPGVAAVNRGDNKTALETYSSMMKYAGHLAKSAEGDEMKAGADQVLQEMQSYANGGRLIQGPGTGISDSIPGRGPNGEGIRVSHGEYIIPADVVEKFGSVAFDQLVSQHHVPAAMQKAIMGDNDGC